MKRSSVVALSICLIILMLVGVVLLSSRNSPEILTPEYANSIIENMQGAVKKKSVGSLMSYFSDDGSDKFANLSHTQLRKTLARAFFNSKTLTAECKNVAVHPGASGTDVEFDLSLKNEGELVTAEDYNGHITLHMKRETVAHAMGLYRTQEWRIVGAQTTGRDPASIGQVND